MLADERTLEELIARTAKGERKAFHDLYVRTAPRMLGIAYRMLGRMDLAEEAVQDAYVSAWSSAKSFRADEGTPVGWIATITRRRAIDRLRASPWLKREIPEFSEAWAIHRDRLGAIALKECLARLAEKTRYAICLAYLYGMTHQEISAKTGQPLGTVKSRIRRGIHSLRDCLSL